MRYELIRNFYPFKKGDIFIKVNEDEYGVDKGSFKLKLHKDIVENDINYFKQL
jgi:hypothetical protein